MVPRETPPPIPEIPTHESATFANRSINPGDMLLGRYKVWAQVGEDGLCKSYLVSDTRLFGRSRLAKVLDPDKARLDGSFEAARSMLAQEALILDSLDHPGIPSVFEAQLEGATPMIIVSHCEGKTLKRVLLENGPRSEADVLGWMLQLCDILGYLHMQDPPIAHRDVKPANLLLCPDGKVCLTHFTCAMKLDADDQKDAVIAYTPGYAAPEQLLGMTTAQSDLFSAGVTMYELLAGKLSDDARFNSTFDMAALNTAASVKSIVTRCVEQQPARRFQSAADLSDALAAALDARPLAPKPKRNGLFGRAGKKARSSLSSKQEAKKDQDPKRGERSNPGDSGVFDAVPSKSSQPETAASAPPFPADLVAVFRDTAEVVASRSYPFAHASSEHRSSRYYPADEVVRLVSEPDLRMPISFGARCRIIVENCDSLAGAELAELFGVSLASDEKPPLVLNFANPHEPGGGVERGARAQEEDLCRRSTLHASLTSDAARSFYADNRASESALFTHGMILSPCVEVFKDAEYARMREPRHVAVLTCPAPYAVHLGDMAPVEIAAVCKQRIKGMLMVAAANGYRSLVLGAWGCGAFGNDPQMMAQMFREALDEIRCGVDGDPERGVGVNVMFRCIVFAVLDRSESQRNLRAFEAALGDFHKAADDAELARIQRDREQSERYLGRFLGCLLGGMAGDALGYPVEFMSYEEICATYGEGGIRHVEPGSTAGGGEAALVSDDTQMTLFTAAGILTWSTRGHLRGVSGPVAGRVYRAYLDWLKTQDPSFSDNPNVTWLLDVRDLHARRAPGNTCLSALRSGRAGSLDDPINNSKGCGGVMRVAPWGLFCRHGDERLVREGAEIAAITHGHPLGWIPAGALCYIVNRCAYEVPDDYDDWQGALRHIVADCADRLEGWFPEQMECAREAAALLHEALDRAGNGLADHVNIEALGQGWVAEEALAIAAYAAVRHADDLAEALVAAANHSGDSDSTAAICGNILGALQGVDPDSDWQDMNVELVDVVAQLAKDLCDDCPMEEYGHYRDEEWLSKYARASSPLLAINDFLRGH